MFHAARHLFSAKRGAVVTAFGTLLAVDCALDGPSADAAWEVRQRWRLAMISLQGGGALIGEEERALFERERFFRKLTRRAVFGQAPRDTAQRHEIWRATITGDCASAASELARIEARHVRKHGSKSREERVLLHNARFRQRRASRQQKPSGSSADFLRALLLRLPSSEGGAHGYSPAQVDDFVLVHEHLATKCTAQLWGLKGESSFVRRMPAMKANDHAPQEVDDPMQQQQRTTFTWDGFSRTTSSLMLASFLRSRGEEFCSRFPAVATTLDRALLLNELMMGKSYKPRELSSSSSGRANNTTRSRFLALFRAEFPAVGARSAELAVAAARRRLRQGECVPLITGTTGHSIAVLLAPNYVCVSNAGVGASGRHGVSIYSIEDGNGDDGQRWFDRCDASLLEDLLHGSLKRESLSTSLAAAAAASSSSATAAATTQASSDRKAAADKSAPPPWLASLVGSTSAVALAAHFPMRRQVSGNCSFESCSKPLVLFGMMLSSSSGDHGSSSGELRAPETAALCLHALQRVSPLYWRFEDSLRHHALLDLLRTRTLLSRHRHAVRSAGAQREGDERITDELVSRVLSVAASRPANLRPHEMEQVIDALLEHDGDDAKNSLPILPSLLHMAACAGDAKSVKKLLAMPSPGSADPRSLKQSRAQSLRDGRPAKVEMTAIEAVQRLVEAKKAVFVCGVSPVPTATELRDVAKLLR